MNGFTLTFIDKNLEKKYQENYSLELFGVFRYTMGLMSISNIILSMFLIQREKTILGYILISISCSWTLIFYYLKMKQYYISLIGYLISTLSLFASFYHLIPLYYPDFTDEQYEWIFDISQFLALNFALTPNFMLNQILQLICIFSRLFMRNYNYINPYSFIFTLYLILFWQKEYFRQKHNRSLFLLNEQQKSSFSIWNDLVDEKIVLLTYNELWERIELLYANKSMNGYIILENKDFLKDFMVMNTKISLNQYLQERVRDKTRECQIRVIHMIKKDRFIVNCLINKFVDFRITIKFSECQTSVMQQCNNNAYLRILQKIKKINKKLYYKENLRNLLYTSYYIKERIVEQVEQLKYYKLRQFMDIILKKDDIHINFEIKQFSTVLPLFYTLLFCLMKIYDITNISLKEQNTKNIQLIIYGNDLDIPIHQFKVCKKIVSHLLYQIGQDECDYQQNFCCLTLVNQPDIMEQTSKNEQLVTFSNIM
ncbi:unnamed protein product [Paramecium primaurelia]|uniref:Transmembrane protein n=1 Tax=Paramecium primaurelia TaxID=5886 RepID=A0A8S1PY10_PARPR|nr:unnamed protein product [Paramecium primaurelia]